MGGSNGPILRQKVESSGKAADHYLDLSLGKSSSKHNSNSQALGNASTDQHMVPESNWRNGGSKSKFVNILPKPCGRGNMEAFGHRESEALRMLSQTHLQSHSIRQNRIKEPTMECPF
ncbi:Floral homeotic protein APETALA 2 [Sesbania bispinosa]|nr:Floral homeotic protein APETALA 2 [Sesbania bispinosa]